MPDLFITVLIFIAVIAITALIFGGWLVVITVAAIGKLLLLPLRGTRQQLPLQARTETESRCENGRCRADNPGAASFCRRCGAPLRRAQPAPSRRVAMW